MSEANPVQPRVRVRRAQHGCRRSTPAPGSAMREAKPPPVPATAARGGGEAARAARGAPRRPDPRCVRGEREEEEAGTCGEPQPRQLGPVLPALTKESLVTMTTLCGPRTAPARGSLRPTGRARTPGPAPAQAAAAARRSSARTGPRIAPILRSERGGWGYVTPDRPAPLQTTAPSGPQRQGAANNCSSRSALRPGELRLPPCFGAGDGANHASLQAAGSGDIKMVAPGALWLLSRGRSGMRQCACALLPGRERGGGGGR